jgi:hypothetical protein
MAVKRSTSIPTVKMTVAKKVSPKKEAAPKKEDNPFGEVAFKNGVAITVAVIERNDGSKTELTYGPGRIRKFVAHKDAIVAVANGEKLPSGYTLTKFKGRDILSVKGAEKGGIVSASKAKALAAAMPRMEAYLQWKGN